MAMSEILVLVVLAALGYGLVSYLWPSGSKDRGRGKGGGPPPDPEGVRQQDGAHRERPERWYEVLGVDIRASTAEITRAYRTQISRHHPDKVAQMGPQIQQVAEARTKLINAAYEEGMALRRAGL